MGKQDHQGITALLTGCRALVLMAIAVLAHNLSSAQPYRPMLGEGAKWGEYYFGFHTEVYVRHLAGDSVIDGDLYLRVETLGNPVSVCATLLREDTVERKVYFHDDTSGDLLLYDFSLLPGDSGVVYQCSSDLTDTALYAYYIVLDSISVWPPADVTTLINGPRFFYGHGSVESQLQPFIWLEGVGSFHGLEMARPLDEGFGWLRLTCHADTDGIIDYIAEVPGWQDTCFSVYSLNSIQENETLNLSIDPNPASDRLVLRTRSSDADMQLEIGDAQGRPLKTTRVVAPTMDLDVSALPSGMYFLSLRTEGMRRTVRFAVAR